MRTVFTDEMKFEIKRLDSEFLSVKSVSITNLPNVNGVFIDSSFRKDTILTQTNQKVTNYMVTYMTETYLIILTMSFRISKLDISPVPATREDSSSELMGSFFMSFSGIK